VAAAAADGPAGAGGAPHARGAARHPGPRPGTRPGRGTRRPHHRGAASARRSPVRLRAQRAQRVVDGAAPDVRWPTGAGRRRHRGRRSRDAPGGRRRTPGRRSAGRPTPWLADDRPGVPARGRSDHRGRERRGGQPPRASPSRGPGRAPGDRGRGASNGPRGHGPGRRARCRRAGSGGPNAVRATDRADGSGSVGGRHYARSTDRRRSPGAPARSIARRQRTRSSAPCRPSC
jgi:hypothetical protein